MKIDSREIDAVAAEIIDSAKDGRFCAGDILSRLPVNPENMEAEEVRIERGLDADDRLFKDVENNSYVVRSEFFKGREFILTPSEIEIENNILFPGHRFSSFCENEIFPSEVKLLDENGSEFKTKEFTHEVTELMPYHIFLGSEQIFDYFTAENPENKALAEKKASQRDVILNVFDMKDLYEKSEFTFGDALLVTVKDWERGIFSFSYLSGTERRNSGVKRWINEFGSAVEQVIDRFEEYLEIPDQLRWAFFLGGEILWGAEAGSLDEFQRETDRIEINFDNAGHAVLVRKIAPRSEEMEIPENVAVSRGRTDSLVELLADIDSPLKAVELDAYIMSQCYQGNPDFDSFFRRCFGMTKLSFADDAQEVIFLNYLEDRWETLFSQYNRAYDKPKAELREQVLDTIDERLAMLEQLKSMDIAPEQLPAENMKKLAEVSIYFNELLEVLNSESHALKEKDEEDISEAIERMTAIQAGQIEEIRKYVKL